MPVYVLRHFRAEIIRLLFVAKGQEFEDKLYTFETWPAEKPNTPFGQLPVLTVDGKDYTEYTAINRFLARELGLMGSNSQEEYEIDRVISLSSGVSAEVIKIFHEQDKDKKAQLEKSLRENVIPKFMSNLEQLAPPEGTGFCVGNKLNLGDLIIFDTIDGKTDDATMNKFPSVKAIMDKVRSNERIKAYLASRAPTPFD
ncbi:probable glutathione S-transferase 6 [Haliotis cracherodii]|uniref:probable glutathione S-transferase 6 n=1 Tax=Haliotis cracherodii TaxID=6455 RepID=UPI0039E89487